MGGLQQQHHRYHLLGQGMTLADYDDAGLCRRSKYCLILSGLTGRKLVQPPFRPPQWYHHCRMWQSLSSTPLPYYPCASISQSILMQFTALNLTASSKPHKVAWELVWKGTRIWPKGSYRHQKMEHRWMKQISVTCTTTTTTIPTWHLFPWRELSIKVQTFPGVQLLP